MTSNEKDFTKRICHQCDTEAARFGSFWICPTHGQLPEAAPPKSLRIFLSYGHDEHASLALRLRDDLRERKHTVWFDEERLQPGHDWEAFIEKGLEHLAADKANAAVILLLTPHSVRRPDGYCLNEVARALALGLLIVPLMVVESEPPLSICRIQWLDMRECLPIHEKEAFYRPRFERLLKALEENQLDFEGTQQRLLKALQPLEFDADILRHLPKFTGRQWVFDAIDQWLAENPPKQRVFWISGGPGVGKTAISAVLSSRYLEVAALHLCKFGHAQKSDPRSVVTSVVYQLTTQLPDYEARLASMDVDRLAQDDARTMFDNLLVQPLAKLTPPKRSIVILIDALDEATREGRNELASFIAVEFPKTPAWLRLIITSRPEAEVTAPLQGLNPFILDTDIESNRADIRDYLRRELASQLQSRPDAEHIIEQIVAKSEGLFLYIERVCDDIQQGNLTLDRLDQFPQGLGGVYWQFFSRQFPDLDRFRKEIRPALRAILAAREPLPVGILQKLFDWEAEDLRDFTRVLGSLFPVAKTADAETIKPCHKSVRDWLTDATKAGGYFVSEMEGHRLLGEWSLMEYRRSRLQHIDFEPTAYPKVFLIVHMLSSGQIDLTLECISDHNLMSWLSPTAYGVGYERGGIMGSAASRSFSSIWEGLLPRDRQTLGWPLAFALGRQALSTLERGLQICSNHQCVIENARVYLLKHAPRAFEEYRDIIYMIPILTEYAVEVAISVSEQTPDHQAAIRNLLSLLQKPISFCKYLSDVASQWGWSMQVEDLARSCEIHVSRLMENERQ